MRNRLIVYNSVEFHHTDLNFYNGKEKKTNIYIQVISCFNKDEEEKIKTRMVATTDIALDILRA